MFPQKFPVSPFFLAWVELGAGGETHGFHTKLCYYKNLWLEGTPGNVRTHRRRRPSSAVLQDWVGGHRRTPNINFIGGRFVRIRLHKVVKSHCKCNNPNTQWCGVQPKLSVAHPLLWYVCLECHSRARSRPNLVAMLLVGVLLKGRQIKTADDGPKIEDRGSKIEDRW